MSDSRSKFIRARVAARETGSEVITARPPFDPQEFAHETERVTLPVPDATPSDAPELASGTIEVFLPFEATTIPELTVAREDLEWFDLAPLARRLLEHIDGEASVEAICLRAGLPVTDAIDLVEELAREGLVAPR